MTESAQWADSVKRSIIFKGDTLQPLITKRIVIFLKQLDWVILYVADPPPANSTTDTHTHPLVYGQPHIWSHRQKNKFIQKQNPFICDPPLHAHTFLMDRRI